MSDVGSEVEALEGGGGRRFITDRLLYLTVEAGQRRGRTDVRTVVMLADRCGRTD